MGINVVPKEPRPPKGMDPVSRLFALDYHDMLQLRCYSYGRMVSFNSSSLKSRSDYDMT